MTENQSNTTNDDKNFKDFKDPFLDKEISLITDKDL